MSKVATNNTIFTTSSDKGRPRSKSVGDIDTSKLLALKKVDDLEPSAEVGAGAGAGAGGHVETSVEEETVYYETGTIMNTIFQYVVDFLIQILPLGSALVGGTALVYMGKKFGKDLNYLTTVVKKKGDETTEHSFTRDIDVILPQRIRVDDIIVKLRDIGKVKIGKVTQTYGGNTTMKKIHKLTSLKLTIPLRVETIKGIKSGPLSFFAPFLSKELLEKFPKQFVIDIDLVEVGVNDVSQLADHWFVTNELRMYAFMIMQKGCVFTPSGRDQIPVRISSILPPSMMNHRGKPIVALNAIFHYVKGLCWEASALPNRTRSGLIIPETTTEPLLVETELDLIARLANIYSDSAKVHVSTPDVWVPHLVYNKSITVEDVRKTFHFGKLKDELSPEERTEFRNSTAKRIHDHIHDTSSKCCICQYSLAEEGRSFVALPCGCSSVIHLECFVTNYMAPALTSVLNHPSGLPAKKETECPLCRTTWWKLTRPHSKIEFRPLNKEKSQYYTVDEIVGQTILQLKNIKLYSKLRVNVDAIDYLSFVE